MIKVVTLQHIYGKNRERMAELLKTLVENELKDLEVKVEISITPENWAEFSVCKFADLQIWDACTKS
jgi:hypothetical protein